MSYRIETDERPADGLRRLMTEQSDRALAELRDVDQPTGWRVHQLRKRCKKLRAALRLARPGLPAYKEANRAFRDIARTVSAHRDARVLYELVQALAGGSADGEGIESTIVDWHAERCRLAERHARELLPTLDTPLVAATARIRRWPLDAVDDDAIRKGHRKTLKRARKGFRKASRKPSPDVFHAWRKRAKYHWLHLRLLRANETQTAARRRKLADELADALGDAHDRSVLIAEVEAGPSWLRSPQTTQKVLARAAEERRALRRAALERGELLFSGEAAAALT